MRSIGQVARDVGDLDASVRWYRDVLGLPLLYRFDALAFFDCAGVRLMLTSGGPSAQSILYFAVGDIHAAHQRLVGAGVRFVAAPHMIHRHDDGTEEWMAFFDDPDGRPLAIMARATPPEQGEKA